MSPGKIVKWSILAVLALLVVPVIVTPFLDGESRHFTRVRLSDVEYAEVNFTNEAEDLDLAGILLAPEGKGPFPGVVFIHGSGTSRRDSGWYLTPAAYLQQNGIVVLLPDKRGSEHSEGDWRTSSYTQLASDTLAAVDYLRDQSRVAISEVGIIGMSQGGHIAPIVADEDTELAFLINVVGAAVPQYDQLYYEEVHNIRQFGILPGFAHILAVISTWSITELRQKAFWDAVGNFDPLPYWQRIDIPALVLYGGLDTNVPSKASAERLASLNNPWIDVRIYEDSGHALETPVGEPASIFREDALEAIRQFIFSAVRSGAS